MQIWKRSEFLKCVFILCMCLLVDANFDSDWNTETRKDGVRSMAINEGNNSIKTVYYKDGQPRNGTTVQIIVGVDAMITRTSTRTNFGQEEREYYKKLDPLPDDERGHLVASTLNGPSKWYNLAPQNKVVNRNVKEYVIVTDWLKTEGEMRAFVDKNKESQGKVQWRVLCFYSNTNRPTKFRFQAIFLNGKDPKLPIEGMLVNSGTPGIRS